jgi:biopolymer transport protein TolR
MAFNLGGDPEDQGVMADINVTPLVDVMLVLLIIFMIAAPMLHQGIEVALPRAEAKNLPIKVEDPIVLSIDRDGRIYIRAALVPEGELVDRLKPQVAARPGEAVFLKGDRDVPYGKVIDVLDVLRRGGIQNVGMVTERPLDRTGRRGRRARG